MKLLLDAGADKEVRFEARVRSQDHLIHSRKYYDVMKVSVFLQNS